MTHRGQRSARAERPDDARAPASGALKRQPVSGRFHGEIPGDKVGPRYEEEQRAEHQDGETVDDHPEAMVVGIALQRVTDDRHGPVGIEIRGIYQDRGVLMSEMPQQSLFGHPLRHPTRESNPNTRHPAIRTPVAPPRSVELRHLLEATKPPPGDAAAWRVVGLRRLAVELVTNPAPGDQKHLHV